MAKKATASLAPQMIGDHDWYYEQRTHMQFVHEVYGELGNHIRTDTIKIPWRKIEASLKRVRASARRRKRT